MEHTEHTGELDLLTVKDAAEVANESPSWVRKAINLGLLPFIDNALEADSKRRELRVNRADLVAFLMSRRRQEAKAPKAEERLGSRCKARP